MMICEKWQLLQKYREKVGTQEYKYFSNDKMNIQAWLMNIQYRKYIYGIMADIELSVSFNACNIR